MICAEMLRSVPELEMPFVVKVRAPPVQIQLARVGGRAAAGDARRARGQGRIDRHVTGVVRTRKHQHTRIYIVGADRDVRARCSAEGQARAADKPAHRQLARPPVRRVVVAGDDVGSAAHRQFTEGGAAPGVVGGTRDDVGAARPSRIGNDYTADAAVLRRAAVVDRAARNVQVVDRLAKTR